MTDQSDNWRHKAVAHLETGRNRPSACGSPLRQTGVTTRQMMEAPQGAIYVWPNSHLDYPRRLARHLDRLDLKIVSAGSVRFETVAGKRVTMIVDHAAEWTITDRLAQWPTSSKTIRLDHLKSVIQSSTTVSNGK